MPHGLTRLFFLLFGCGLIALAFARGVGTGYLFDDYTSVVPLQQLRDSGEYFWYFVLDDGSGPLGRAVSIFTFAVEQWLFDASPAFSQRVSIGLHAINFLIACALLQALLARRASGAAVVGAAIFAAAFWALAPQKVSSVLYIVQRMTLLSATFTMLAVYGYLRARRPEASLAGRVTGALLCLVAAAIAPFAKETGALALPLIVLVEVFNPRRDGRLDDRLRLAAITLLAAGTFLYLLLGVLEYQRADASYALRQFSFAERLLSTPLVLLDYLEQFFVPDISRMGIVHDDYRVATTGADPLAWYLACVALAVALLYVVRCIYKQRASLAALGIAWFLAGHSIESTFLPLEIYFEHRNYLPSVGLALVLASGCRALAAPLRSLHRLAAPSAAMVIVAASALTTAALAGHWSSARSLYLHHFKGHPESARAAADAALIVAGSGRADEARSLVAGAFELSRSQKAARAMGPLDRVLLEAAVACLAGESIVPARLPTQLPLEADPLRGAVVRSLQRLHRDGVCRGADWSGLSAWIERSVARSLEGGHRLRGAALRDLSDLEYSRGEMLRSYVYAAMLAEQRPEDSLAIMMKVRAAVSLGDSEALASGVRDLRALSGRGQLDAETAMFLDALQSRNAGVPAGQAVPGNSADPEGGRSAR